MATCAAYAMKRRKNERAQVAFRSATGLWSIYIHIPFCRVRCTYCAFNTYTGRDDRFDAYVNAVITELALLSRETPRVHTVYLGGGTPSLLNPRQIENIIAAIHAQFETDPDLEITVEANPGTVSSLYLRALRSIGVTRLSLGMQSAHQTELALFGRLHGLADVVSAVQDARQAGFGNVNVDLLYGSPNQTRAMWRTTLRAALDLETDHISLYALSLESGTELKRRVTYGNLPPPDSDLAADMYNDATELLEAAGFRQYEISNWALPGKACRHNLQYWRNLPYLGVGAGAHGYAGHIRTVNVMKPEHYIERLSMLPDEPSSLPFPETPATLKTDEIDRETDMAETVFMGLRLIEEGLSLTAFERRYGEPFEQRFGPQLERLISLGLLFLEGDRLKLTPRARLISNLVFEQFVEG
jgi:oxygen-independent coproporphyrinogen-3 oxidase